jgi:hypothetical protein
MAEVHASPPAVVIASPSAIPIAKAFAVCEAVPVPGGWGPFMSPQVWGVLAASQTLTVRQHVKLLPKQCCSCPPCVKQENTYSIYAGLSQDAKAELLRADEVSDDWNRCCCAPHHPVKLEIRPYIPTPEELGMPAGTSDLSNTLSDVNTDWMRLTGKEKAAAEKNAYQAVPVSLTMIRDGTQFPACCNKAVGCFVCTTCCTDGMTLVAGKTAEADKKEIGSTLISNLDPNMTIGSATVPVMSAFFSPTLHVMERGGLDGPFAKVEGPMCFGGLSECCCSFNFPVSQFNGPSKAGDIAKITKQKPKSFGAAIREGISSADLYTIEFDGGKQVTPEQKALLLSSLLLNDYTYFEGPQDMCGTDPNDGQCYLNFCNCYCCGVLCPCKLKGGGEGG